MNKAQEYNRFYFLKLRYFVKMALFWKVFSAFVPTPDVCHFSPSNKRTFYEHEKFNNTA